MRATGTAPAAVLGTINFTVGGPFNVEPASEMSDINGPQDAVKFNVAAIPSVEREGSGPAFLRPGQLSTIAEIQRLQGLPPANSPSLPLSMPGDGTLAQAVRRSRRHA